MGQYDRFALAGGLDTATPYLARQPGTLTYCRNFENDTDGGYRMLNGFERFDGHPSPSATVVTNLHMSGTVTGLLPGQTITNGNGATGVVGLTKDNEIWVDIQSTAQFIPGDQVIEEPGLTVLYTTEEPVALNSYNPAAQRTTLTIVTPDVGFDPQVGMQAIGLTSGARVLVNIVFQTIDKYRLFVTPLEGQLLTGEVFQMANGTTGTLDEFTEVEAFLSTPYTPAGVWYYLSELRRQNITMVPGTGPVRGVWELNGKIYAFRDAVGGATGGMYVSTPTGWLAVSMGVTLKWKDRAITVLDTDLISGDQIQGVTSGATATVQWIGYTASDLSTGYMTLTAITGTFVDGEDLKNLTNTKIVGKADGAATPNTLAPGGTYRFVNHNYFAGQDTYAMYCADGVGPGFTYCEARGFSFIITGNEDEKPIDVISHKHSLFFSFHKSLLLFSAPDDPFNWSGGLGAGALGLGAEITGLVSSPSSLIICTIKDVQSLSGDDDTTFKLDIVTSHSGIAIYSAKYQAQTFAVSRAGITAIDRTQQFGNFSDATMSDVIRDLLRPRYDQCLGAMARKDKGQYLVFYENDVNFAMSSNQGKVLGFSQFDHGGLTVRTSNNPEGRVFFTSDTGYVYQDDAGFSNDGDERVSTLRMSFANQGDPNTRKRFRRLDITCTSDTFVMAALGFTYDKGRSDFYDNVDSGMISSKGGRWDMANWNEVYWDAAEFPTIHIDIDGSGSDISASVYISSRIQSPFILEDMSYEWSPRRKVR